MGEDIHWQKYASRFKTFPASVKTPPSDHVGLIVCIPVYAEPHLISTLASLCECELPDAEVEVILLFNKSDRMSYDEIIQHDQMWEICKEWIHQHPQIGLQFRPVYIDSFPDSRGGVGWARKLVMDEAARRLEQEGIILCLDGDCLVEKNYLKVIYTYFQQHPSCDAASIYFEHQLDHLDPLEREAIAQYELHLRYLVHALRWAGHPFSFQTVGSSMAVRRKAYLAHGGMNTREAGEDFYFLQKFIEIDALHEITETTVYPSARISHRVPFGTGRAMQSILSSSGEWMTTDFKVFRLIKPLLSSVDAIRKLSIDPEWNDKKALFYQTLGLHEWVIDFLKHIGFSEQCRQIASQTTTIATFRRRFFRYFNSFMMIRYMHYSIEHYVPKALISVSVMDLLAELKVADKYPAEIIPLLDYFRHNDRFNPSL